MHIYTELTVDFPEILPGADRSNGIDFGTDLSPCLMFIFLLLSQIVVIHHAHWTHRILSIRR